MHEVIDKKICTEKKVLRITDLLNVYTEHARQTEFRNDGCRSEKLKKKILALEKYSSELGFIHLDEVSKFSSYVVYKTTPTEELIKNSHELGTSFIQILTTLTFT